MKTLPATVLFLLAAAAAVGADNLPGPGAVMQARWSYSTDGGKTWGPEAPKVSGTNSPTGDRHDAARAEFTVEDPAKIGLVRVAFRNHVPNRLGAFALSDANSVDRYNIGSCPVLLNTKITLNGKASDLGHDPNTLYRCLSIEASQLKPGANTLELAGFLWHKCYDAGAALCDLQLEVVPPNTAAFDRLPFLGMVCDTRFGIACRAVIPSRFTVAVTPLEPAGMETRQEFGPARLLQAAIALPKGTRVFRYSVTVSAGGASQTCGPYNVRVPQGGVGFRFAAGGGTAFYPQGPEGVAAFLAKLTEIKPDVFIHTGNYQNCTCWDFAWTQDFLRVAQPTFASIPMFATANITEMMSPESFGHTFYFPPDNADASRWTVAIGNVRFVAIEAFGMSEEKSEAGLKWLEETLKNAREDYVFLLNSHAADCVRTGVGRLYHQGRTFAAAKIDPLLVRYNVTAVLANMYRGYNRIEPRPDQGVPTILSGKSGGYLGLNFKIPLSHLEQVKARGDSHYLLFEVKSDGLEMKAVDLFDGKAFDTRTFKPRKP